MKVGIVLQQTKASIIAVKVTVRWFLPCAWKDKSNPASHHSSPLSSAIPSASLADMRKIQCANQRITSQQEFVIESLKCLSAKNFINKQSAGSVWEYHPSKDGRMLHVRRGKQTLCSLRGVQWVCWWGHIYECVFVCWIRYEGLWMSVYRQVPATSRRQQRPEALIYHWTVIRHTFFRAGTR